MLKFFHNYGQKLKDFLPKIWSDLPIHLGDFYNFIFTLEYVIFSSIFLLPIGFLFNSYFIPSLTNYSKSSDRITLYLLLIIIQTVFTIMINSLNKIIYDIPSIVDFTENDNKLRESRDDSIRSGINIGTSLFLLPSLMGIIGKLDNKILGFVDKTLKK